MGDGRERGEVAMVLSLLAFWVLSGLALVALVARQKHYAARE